MQDSKGKGKVHLYTKVKATTRQAAKITYFMLGKKALGLLSTRLQWETRQSQAHFRNY